MAVSIDLSGVVGAVPTVCTQLRVTLPGGLAVQGTVPQIGASPLEAARATIGALNSALAPLGPVFSIIDALLALVKFAQTVPKVVMQPDKVVAALVDVVKKAGKLASLVPQLSVPLMVLGTIDVLIAFLAGLSDEVTAIAAMEARLAELVAIATTVPAMGPISASVTDQISGRRAQLTCALGDVVPLLGVVNVFCELVGLPPIEIDADPQSGSLDDVAEALATAVHALQTVRAAIPV